MSRPPPADFGLTQQDIDWAKRARQHIVLALLLASALGWGLYGLPTVKLLHPLLAVRALIVGFCLVFITAFVVAVPAEGILYLACARYRRARRYLGARRRLRARDKTLGH